MPEIRWTTSAAGEVEGAEVDAIQPPVPQTQWATGS